MEFQMNTLAHSTVDGRSVWLYQFVTPIGSIHVLDYEQKNVTIKRKLYDEQQSKAEKDYVQIIKKIAAGKL